MMELPSYFKDFLQDIRPTASQIGDYKSGHTTLRKRLWEDERLSKIIVSDFLQGSYRRATAIRPQGDKRADVDVIVVTKLSQQEYTPEAALKLFEPFLEKHYKGKYEVQGRSFGITLSYVDLDIVPTAAPSESEIGIFAAASVTADENLEEAEDWRLTKSWMPQSQRPIHMSRALLESLRTEPEWKLSPLIIPDREARRWDRTHPLEQIRWTREKNAACHGHYVNVVKAIKWWRRINHSTPKYPKGSSNNTMVPDSVVSAVFLPRCRMDREYRSDNRQFGVRIPGRCIETIVKLCGAAGRNETGGILIGTYNERHDCAHIMDVIPPPADSRRGRTWFARGVRGLQNLLNRLWRTERSFYVGEWHFHPFAAPIPSDQDMKQMQTIAATAASRCPEPLLFILGGDPAGVWDMAVFVFPRGRNMTRLQVLVMGDGVK
jgi:integrative and conjugative element protein (TIGR02256 family)